MYGREDVELDDYKYTYYFQNAKNNMVILSFQKIKLIKRRSENNQYYSWKLECKFESKLT